MQSEWDLIVVGAGSSGAALATRSAQAGKRVLLLEAGPNYRSAEMPEVWRSPNPAAALMEPSATEGLVWPQLTATRTETQPPIPYWRGRGVGGSSSINGQIAIRPPMVDFEDWVAEGCTGWSPADVLPYFARLEHDEQFGGETYHGQDGPTPIYRAPRERWGGVDAALADACLAAGLPWAEDVNAPGAIGVSTYPINSRESRRVSVNDAYLESARELDTLTIEGGALVDRVVIESGRAVGVRVATDGEERVERAGEIVLSAGAIHSPAILMRSGIGPASHLRGLGITPVVDLPVGEGLQDHPIGVVSLPLTEGASISSIHDRHTNVCARVSSANGYADLMFVSMNVDALAMASAEPTTRAGAYGVWLNGTHSRGTVALASADPTVDPVVRERMLSDPRDLERMREGVRRLVDLARSAETAAILGGSLDEANAGLFAVLDDDDALDEHLLASVGDAQHGTSTCRMGDPSAPTTVVDPECRVLGVDGLRVVDASICPSVPRANTNLTAIMIGELMADRIG